MESNDKEQREQTAAVITSKRKKRRTKRLLLLLLLLLFTGIMLGTSTYAWFTANKTVTVSDITVDVAAKNGIQISVDAQNWKSVVQTTDITGATATYSSAVNKLPASMEPVSTIAELDDNGHIGMYYGVVETSTNCSDNVSTTASDCTAGGGIWVTGTCNLSTYTTSAACETAGKQWITGSNMCTDTTITNSSACSTAGGTWSTVTPEGNYILTATKEEDSTTNKYVVFDLFFQVNQDTTVYMNLGTASGVIADSGHDTGIQNASRMAFVKLGHAAAGSAPTTYQALNGGTSSTVTVWEPNYDTSTQTGVNNALSVYSISTTTPTHDVINYLGVKDEIALANNQLLNSKNTTYFGEVNGLNWKTTNGQTGQITFDTMQAGVTKYRIYMWIEGQDIDCENEASGGRIIYRLQFTTTAEGSVEP